MATHLPIHVLLVDDEPLMRLAIAQALADEGCLVFEAADGAATQRALLRVASPFDVIILDHRLPDSRELDLLPLVRRIAPHARVIMITNHPTPELVERAWNQGVAAILHKPVDLDDLCRRVMALSA